jgi:DNA-binding NarL/FixJ family response regulator
VTKRLSLEQTFLPPTSLLIKEAPAQPYRRLEPEQPGPATAITPRQQEVLFCLVEGKPTKKICTELGISEGTAKVHISAIFRALRVRNRTQATLVALREGWIQPEMWSRS